MYFSPFYEFKSSSQSWNLIGNAWVFTRLIFLISPLAIYIWFIYMLDLLSCQHSNVTIFFILTLSIILKYNKLKIILTYTSLYARPFLFFCLKKLHTRLFCFLINMRKLYYISKEVTSLSSSVTYKNNQHYRIRKGEACWPKTGERGKRKENRALGREALLLLHSQFFYITYMT